MTAIDPNLHCYKCDDQILNDVAPVTANILISVDGVQTERAVVWHAACVPEYIKSNIEMMDALESSYDRENPDG